MDLLLATSRSRRRIDWDEPCPAGRSHNEYLRAGHQGRVTPHKQEQDPRRDVLGCNRITKRTIAIEPEKEPQSIMLTSFADIVSATRALIAAPGPRLAFLCVPFVGWGKRIRNTYKHRRFACDRKRSERIPTETRKKPTWHFSLFQRCPTSADSIEVFVRSGGVTDYKCRMNGLINGAKLDCFTTQVGTDIELEQSTSEYLVQRSDSRIGML